jgi:uncharacterized protein YggU (UPF0235/DUF167 family)
MIIKVRVIPNSSVQKIESFLGNNYLIKLTSLPEDNEANIELIKMLCKYFTVSSSSIKIKFGLTGRDKIIEIL